MKTSKLLQLLTTFTQNQQVTDPLFNSVDLLIRFDKEANTKGLQFFRDFSKYNYQVREVIGSSSNSNFLIKDNIIAPTFPNQGSDNVLSYGYFNNKFNHLLRVNELNALPSLFYRQSNFLESDINPSYLEVMLNGNNPISLGTSDWTIELNFFTESVTNVWKYQTIFNVGKTLSIASRAGLGTTSTDFTINNYIRPNIGSTANYGLFIANNSLVFIANGVEYVLKTNLSALTWYRIALIRSGNTLKFYNNNTLENSISFNQDLTITNTAYPERTILTRMTLGSAICFNEETFVTNSISDYAIDTSFSGGISNLRITKAVRYSQEIYSNTLPLPLYEVANKLDSNFSNVIWNFPLTYDLYDYSKNLAHISNQQLLKETLNPSYGHLELTNKVQYTSKPITDVIASSQYCFEFYLAPYLTNQLFKITKDEDKESLFDFLFSRYRFQNLNTIANFAVPLLTIGNEGKLGIEVGIRYFRSVVGLSSQEGYYFYVKQSSNGIDWNTYPDEVGIASLNQSFPSDEIKFFAGYSSTTISGLENYAEFDINYGNEEPGLHFAIQKYNGFLYCLVNGEVVKSISSNFNIYQNGNNYLTFGSNYEDVFIAEVNAGGTTIGQKLLTWGIKGFRFSNVNRYNVVSFNNYFIDYSLYPPALSLNSLPPARARVIEILRSDGVLTTGSDTVNWIMYINYPVDNLVLADFNLIQTNGVSGASLTTLTKLSDYEYQITANTGSGNGQLQLNFNDRKTVRYKDTNVTISNAIGELSFEGEAYFINKSRPEVILTSGSNPYVKGNFVIKLQFLGAISELDISKLGLSNCQLEQYSLVDELNFIYELTIKPLVFGVVIVKALDGLGITTIGLRSQESNSLVRIFSEYFEILQTPLTLNSTLFDYSASRLLLDEVIDNNTVFSTTIYPLGTTSSLDVNPLLEQGGLRYLGFNSTGSQFIDSINQDWTIEFFIRINTSSGKFSHILSVEKPSTGFALVANNGFIKVQRSVTDTISLLSTSIKEIPTTNYVTWNDSNFTNIQKYPHVAITKKGNTYRFYMNGVRVGILNSTTAIDITQGDLYLGYYPNRVNDESYYLSNVRITYGKALYTAFNYNIPQLPYEIPLNITEETELLNYISIYSSNSDSSKALEDDVITLKFNSIINLVNMPSVTLQGQSRTVNKVSATEYIVTYTVENSDLDGLVDFSIQITNEPGIPNKTFTQTTNRSNVVIDKSPLTISITTDELNNNAYIVPIKILLSEPSQSLDLNNFTTVNCSISNLIKISDLEYSARLQSYSTGTISVQIQANKIKDLAGNFNLASNTLTRNTQLPDYIPDPYYNNVLLLIQSDQVLIDESQYEHTLENNNVTFSNVTSPLGLSKSLYFNGINTSLSVDIGQSLQGNIPYTIEFFVYMSTSTVFRLGSPTLNPASNISTNSFDISWSEIDQASKYIFDLSNRSDFETYIPGYKNLEVTDTELNVSSKFSSSIPSLKPVKYLSNSGFILDWFKDQEQLAYYVDLALDSNFQTKLYQFNNRVTTDSYFTFGNVSNLKDFTGVTVSDFVEEELVSSELSKGVLLTGLLGNNNSYPKLYYVLEESSIRLYEKENYAEMLIAEDIDIMQWHHIAICNSVKYTYLYLNGEQVDRIKNVSFSNEFDLGYSIGRFKGFINGLRITKGICRYTGDFDIPTLPYSKT